MHELKKSWIKSLWKMDYIISVLFNQPFYLVQDDVKNLTENLALVLNYPRPIMKEKVIVNNGTEQNLTQIAIIPVTNYSHKKFNPFIKTT